MFKMELSWEIFKKKILLRNYCTVDIIIGHNWETWEFIFDFSVFKSSKCYMGLIIAGYTRENKWREFHGKRSLIEI